MPIVRSVSRVYRHSVLTTKVLQNVANLSVLSFGAGNLEPLVRRFRLFARLLQFDLHGRVAHRLDANSASNRIELVLVELTMHTDTIGSMDLVLGQFHVPRVGTAIREQQQAFRVHIEATDRFEVLLFAAAAAFLATTPQCFANARIHHALHDGRSIVRIDFGDQFAFELVHQPDADSFATTTTTITK